MKKIYLLHADTERGEYELPDDFETPRGSFNWHDGHLIHCDVRGDVFAVPFAQFQDYVSTLPSSERQQPIPPYPFMAQARREASGELLQVAADHPGPIGEAANAIIARAEAAYDAAAINALSARESADAAAATRVAVMETVERIGGEIVTASETLTGLRDATLSASSQATELRELIAQADAKLLELAEAKGKKGR